MAFLLLYVTGNFCILPNFNRHLKQHKQGRKTIGNALIEELGPIDRRFLTSEVSRCFDEVMNKYLAPNQLNPVKTESDLTEEGTILYTLNKMHEKAKVQVSQF